PAGKRHQPIFPTKALAEAEAERVRATLRAQHGRTPELPENITWSALFDRVMRDRGDLKPRTLEGYRTTHTRYLAPAFGTMPVRSLPGPRLREFLCSQLTTKEKTTVRLRPAVVHVVLGEATEDALPPANPAAGLARKLKLATQQTARQHAVQVK